MSLDMEENGGFLVCFGFLSEDGDIAVGVETVDDTGASSDARAQTFVADGHAAVGADFQTCTRTPDVGPPRATRNRAQDRAIFAAGFMGGSIGSAAQFAMNLLGVAMAAQIGQERVGGFRGGDVFSGEQSGKSALPVLVLAFDFAFGLGSVGVAQGDAVEV